MPILKDNLASIIKFQIKERTKSVVFLFQLTESEQKNYRTKPIEMLISILVSKHKDGLQEFLLSKGLAIGIDATVSRAFTTNFRFI